MRRTKRLRKPRANPRASERMKIARGFSPWFPITVVAALVALGFAIVVRPLYWLVAAPLVVLALLMVNFFRDPERVPARGLVACADGVVQSIDEWEDGRTRVATFMSPLNVHVNRAPLDARVASVKHIPGGFVPAFDKESDRNERVEWVFETEFGDVTVVQIAGAVARRIVPYFSGGEKVMKGERIGLIRFGSRVDVYLPAGLKPAVKVGDKVSAAETTLAEP
ncbi:MAG: phosphatidylserine decarboxylase [Thermoplasmatota archaeon]